MIEWRKTSNRAGAQEYKAAHGVVFQVATGGWVAIVGGVLLRAPECDAFRHTARALRAGVTPGAFRTAALAMRAADGARDAAKAREYVAQREAGFPAMRAAAVRTAREDDSAMHAPGLSSAARLATFRRVASDEHQRLAFRAAGGIGFGEMWRAWRDAYQAERCALTQARMDARRDLETRRAAETEDEHAARLAGHAMGRRDSGSGAPRESRISHLAYLEACDDSARRIAAFRRGYLETFNDGAFNGAAKEST